ncbi:hypothetical protein [Aeromicrobium sp. NPDC092404]
MSTHRRCPRQLGTRRPSERLFAKAGDTDSVIDGLPRVLMRLDLR